MKSKQCVVAIHDRSTFPLQCNRFCFKLMFFLFFKIIIIFRDDPIRHTRAKSQPFRNNYSAINHHAAAHSPMKPVTIVEAPAGGGGMTPATTRLNRIAMYNKRCV